VTIVRACRFRAVWRTQYAATRSNSTDTPLLTGGLAVRIQPEEPICNCLALKRLHYRAVLLSNFRLPRRQRQPNRSPCRAFPSSRSNPLGSASQSSIRPCVRTKCHDVAYKVRDMCRSQLAARAPSNPRSRRTHGAISGARATRSGKVRKAFWLDPRLLDDARTLLGASSEREAVEMALDLVGFRNELVRGARALRGLALSRID
jgi:hypothetical protein